MALSDIIDKIKAEAAAEAARIEAAGRVDHDKTLGDKNKEIMDALAVLKKKQAERVAKTEEQAEFRARMLKKNATLKLKQELMDEVFRAVKRKLAVLGDDEFRRLLVKMLKGSPVLPGAEIVAPARRFALVKKAVKEADLDYRVSERRLPAGTDGFIISTQTVEINNTIDNYVDARRGEFEAGAAKIIFK